MNKPPFQSLSSRLSLWILIPSLVVFMAVLVSNHYLSRALLQKYTQELAIRTAESVISKIDTTLQTAAGNADALAALITTNNLSAAHIREMIRVFVETSDVVFGMAIALEPETLNDTPEGFAPYYFRKNNQVQYSDLNRSDYAYRQWPWYTATKSSRQAVWSEPYLDEGGGDVHMVTYSTPIFFNSGADFVGVATADIKLSWLDDLIQNSRIGETGYGFILSRDDRIIAHPDPSMHMRALAETGISSEELAIYRERKPSDQPMYASMPCKQLNELCWIALRTLPINGWKALIVLPESELSSEIQALSLKITAIAGLGLLLLLAIISWITRRLTQPLARLAEATRNIGAGRLNEPLPVPQRQDEIGRLTQDFSNMRGDLKNHIKALQAATMRRQKLESEIEIAREIQMSMVPGAGDVLCLKPDWQLFARLIPARRVGGDLYYFAQHEQSLRFIIGDVSDKGIAPALFMARTVTLYARALKDRLAPGETLAMMNEILTEDNDACMFVTALCGEIDLRNGDLRLASAGHMDPLLRDDTGVHALELTGDTALGLNSTSKYSDNHFSLQASDLLLLYTDGITEAHGGSNALYDESRLLQAFTACQMNHVAICGQSILADVNAFAAGTEPFDDITLMMIQAGNPDNNHHLPLRHRLSEWQNLSGFLNSQVAKSRLTVEDQHDLRLLCEEVFANIINHSTQPEDSIFDVYLSQQSTGVRVCFVDRGAAFNPAVAKARTLKDSDRSQGGMGLHLIRSLSDSLDYHRIGDMNVFTISKHYNQK